MNEMGICANAIGDARLWVADFLLKLSGERDVYL